MAEYLLKNFRLTVIDEMGRNLTKEEVEGLAPTLAGRIGRDELTPIERKFVIVKSTDVGPTETSFFEAGRCIMGNALMLDANLADMRRRIEARENEMMLETMGVSRGKIRPMKEQPHNRSGQRMKVTGPDRFSAPVGLSGPGPMQSPRNMMLITEQAPEKSPMTRAERRRAEKLKRKP